MLGLPQDWSPFFQQAHCPNLFNATPLPYVQWAKKLNQEINPKEDNLLVGYSLGGRLGVHALLDNPSLWKGALLISTGLKARPDKWATDQEWSQKFSSLSWETLLEQWNAQPVFQNSSTPMRQEGDFNRQHLSAAFLEWSASKQSDLQMVIEQLPIPIYWVVGEKDPFALHQIFLTHPDSKVIIVPGAGHRVLWDNPTYFKHVIQEFYHACNFTMANH